MGAVNAAAAEKMIRFIDLCDTFHLPCVNFVDNPGFLIGTAAERAGTARIGARALMAVYQATVPWISILLRRVYGVAGAAHGNAQGLNLRYAWPSGDWGSLPIEGGVQAAYRREIEAAARSRWTPPRDRREVEPVPLAVSYGRGIRYRRNHRSARHAPAIVRLGRNRLFAAGRSLGPEAQKNEVVGIPPRLFPGQPTT